MAGDRERGGGSGCAGVVDQLPHGLRVDAEGVACWYCTQNVVLHVLDAVMDASVVHRYDIAVVVENRAAARAWLGEQVVVQNARPRQE